MAGQYQAIEGATREAEGRSDNSARSPAYISDSVHLFPFLSGSFGVRLTLLYARFTTLLAI